ncbi:hypothetical protein [Gracilimonas sp.]|uniref:hypothetical protein n=1 Tax=Gracilimonas sp. TaxID=1974203 RepID=UPI0028723693|nr:hypothetical protein [Gracilimonas sp.]
MSDRIKYSVSTILLILSVIIYFSYNFKGTNIPSDQDSGNNFTTSISIVNSDIEKLFEKIDPDSSGKINPVIILTIEACYLCLNNVTEFSDLLRKDSTFTDPILLFIDENDNEVNKFIRLTELNIPYKNLPSSKINNLFSNLEQNLIFVDKFEKLVFYNFPIPNSIMLPESKLRIIEQAKETWK